MKVAIGKSSTRMEHTTGWAKPWEEYCKEQNIDYEFVDPLKGDVIEKLKGFDVFVWLFSNYNHQEMLEARNILYAAKRMGLKIFPDFNEAWHVDDKVAEMYALKSIQAPIPKSFVYYDIESLEDDIDNGNITFPIVAKLRTGSGSHNVKLIKNKSGLLNYARRMFGRGFNPAPSLFYKTSSNIRSSHNKQQFLAKLKRAPEFLRTLSSARRFPNEKDYVYLQEFIPNDGYDMKVCVVGDKCSYFVRPVRSHDFRASGGGDIFYDKKYFNKQVIESAFKVSDLLGFQCMGYDYVVNKNKNEGVIIETCYGFSHEALLLAGGYFDRSLKWHDEPFNAPKELLNNILNK